MTEHTIRTSMRKVNTFPTSPIPLGKHKKVLTKKKSKNRIESIGENMEIKVNYTPSTYKIKVNRGK